MYKADDNGVRTRPSITTVALLLMLVACGFPAIADEAAAKSLLQKTWDTVQHDETARAEVMARGEERTAYCVYCHGKDGSKTKKNTPILAGQNPFYLLAQFELFAKLEREKMVMEALSQSFSDEEKVTIAVYYALMSSKVFPTDVSSATTDDNLLVQECHGCHDGNQDLDMALPWIGGQNPRYLSESLQRFRERDMTWQAPVMWTISAELSNLDIKSLGWQISQMGTEKSASAEAIGDTADSER